MFSSIIGDGGRDTLYGGMMMNSLFAQQDWKGIKNSANPSGTQPVIEEQSDAGSIEVVSMDHDDLNADIDAANQYR